MQQRNDFSFHALILLAQHNTTQPIINDILVFVSSCVSFPLEWMDI